MLEFTEWDELDNVCGHVLPVLLRVQRLVISIEDIHRAEISRADTHNDDRERQGRSVNNCIDSSLHVRYDAIRNDQQDVVLLVDLRAVHVAGHLVD